MRAERPRTQSHVTARPTDHKGRRAAVLDAKRLARGAERGYDYRAGFLASRFISKGAKEWQMQVQRKQRRSQALLRRVEV